MSYLYNVSVAFLKKDWKKIQPALKKEADDYDSMMSLATCYEDKEYTALKWSEINHFFESAFAKELDKSTKRYMCDYIVSGEDGKVISLSRNLGCLSLSPVQGILPDDTASMNKDGIIVNLVSACLLQGMTEDEIASMAVTLDGYPFSGRDTVMKRLISMAKKEMGVDEVSEKYLGNIALTLTGYHEVNHFVNEAGAKRKEILDAGIDTCDNTPEVTQGDILSDIGASLGEGDFDDEYLNGWEVTDEHDTDYPLCLHVGKHFTIADSDMWMTARRTRDFIGELCDCEVAVPNFVVGEKAIIRQGSKETESKIVACILDAENVTSYLDATKIAAQFETDRGIVTVIVRK